MFLESWSSTVLPALLLRWSNNPQAWPHCLQQQESDTFRGEACGSRQDADLPRLSAVFPAMSSYRGMLHYTDRARLSRLTSFPYSKNTALLSTDKERPCFCWQCRLREQQLIVKYLFSNLNVTTAVYPAHQKTTTADTRSACGFKLWLYWRQ